MSPTSTPTTAPVVPITHQGDRKIDWVKSIPFVGVHVVAVAGIIWLGWSWTGVLLATALYYIRMFAITGGLHRYMAHRSFKTSRAFQFALAALATTASQKGPLWWAAHHRFHHKYSDEPEDIHSAKQSGFWFSHMGWIMCRKYDATDWDRIKDLAKYPELRFLNRFWFMGPISLAVALKLVGGNWALLWGFFVSTAVLWHGTFTVNSLTHLWGRRRYKTTDDSRNSFLIALITMGEGWHNNHHHYQRSERQGFYWWELDMTHYVLTGLSWLGLVWDLHEPPKALRDAREPMSSEDRVPPLVPPSRSVA